MLGNVMRKIVLNIKPQNRHFYVFECGADLPVYDNASLLKCRAWAMQYRSSNSACSLTIEDEDANEYTLGRYSTSGNLFMSQGTRKAGVDMGWDEVKKAAAGPFVSFADCEGQSKRLYVAGEPAVIKGRKIGANDVFEDFGVLPVLEDGKFKVLPLRSTRLRNALLEKWEVIEGKMIDITRKGDGFDTQYEVKLSKSKKKPDARLIAQCDKAFAAFIKNNKKMVSELPETD